MTLRRASRASLLSCLKQNTLQPDAKQVPILLQHVRLSSGEAGLLDMPGAVHTRLIAATDQASLLPLLSTVNSQHQHRSLNWKTAAAAGLCVGGSLLMAQPADCAAEQQTDARPRSWWGWVPFIGRGHATPSNPVLADIAEDPQVAVVLALALPLLSLSFGYHPDDSELASAAESLLPRLPGLRGWELAALLWGAARLGFRPPRNVMDAAKGRLMALVRQARSAEPGAVQELPPQVAAMTLWALAVLGELTPALWASLLDILASQPAESFDEVALLHLYQAGMFAQLRQAGLAPGGQAASAPVPAASGLEMPALGPGAGPGAIPAGAMVAEQAGPGSLQQEVAAKLSRLPPALLRQCEQAYSAAAPQPGFDGPYLVELTILRMLLKADAALGSPNVPGRPRGAAEGGGNGDSTYQFYLHDLRAGDLARARSLLEDPYALTKFKREVADKAARQNDLNRQLADISRTLRSMGLYHVSQTAVEDGLVHVDLALPDYKIAIFLETSPQPQPLQQLQRPGGGVARPAGFLDTDGAALSGYTIHETPGTKDAKTRLLEQLGWKCYTLDWDRSYQNEEQKKAAVLGLFERAGRAHAMRGRVSTMVAGALRTQPEEKSRFEHETAGYHLGKGRGR